MNFAAAQVDMWWPSSRAVPEKERKSFLGWAAGHGLATHDDYPPRALVGRYLAEGFDLLRRYLPPNVELRLWRTAVEAAHPDGRGWAVRTARSTRRYDEILVAVGHQSSPGTGLAARWADAVPLVPRVFPVESRLGAESVPADATVAIRGFALTFLDAALALTEGRAGSFEPTDHAYRLRYVASGDEPAAILPFARSGRPMLAKPGPAIAERVPALGRIAAQGRAQIADLGGTVDLHGDLVPILAATTCSNLAAVAEQRPGPCLRVALGRWLAEAVGGVGALDEPTAAEEIERSLAVGAGLAPPGVPWALGHTWRTLYPALVSRLGGRGLAEHDWPALLRLSAEMERVAFGPPPVNAAKLLALVEAGQVDLTHVRGARLTSRDGGTALVSERGERAVDRVVDAVLPAPGALGHPGLLTQLVADGHARIPGGRRGLETTAAGSCRGRDGCISRGLSAIGRPTEDSVIGNDTLARALHPHADRWARRVVQRCRDDYLAAARSASREEAPA
jgi:diaminopimelate decarboxylase